MNDELMEAQVIETRVVCGRRLTRAARRQCANPTAFIADRYLSVTWPTMSASSPPTGPPWPHCMSGGHG